MLQSRPLFPQKRTRSHSQPFFQHPFYPELRLRTWKPTFTDSVQQEELFLHSTCLRSARCSPYPALLCGLWTSLGGESRGSAQGTNETPILGNLCYYRCRAHSPQAAPPALPVPTCPARRRPSGLRAIAGSAANGARGPRRAAPPQRGGRGETLKSCESGA